MNIIQNAMLRYLNTLQVKESQTNFVCLNKIYIIQRRRKKEGERKKTLKRKESNRR